ncbi:MAG: glycoside hydrolase family 5 protein [Candidatus Hydrogenedentes bacterium]|nr:glycoside hydrolase family 5 protein [Candidatus Hydrogenedentota bacterium]
MITRRLFLSFAVLGGGVWFLNPRSGNSLEESKVSRDVNKFKFWGKLCGFNLQNFFMVHSKRCVEESEIILLRELGFNFVRFPMDYRCWIKGDNIYDVNETVLKEIDSAIDICIKHGVHVCLNFHRAPGWTVAEPPETLNLWKEEEALKASCFHWKLFAERYRDVSYRYLSYNLFNEPPAISEDAHRRVIGKVIEEIRKIDSEKYILCDGRRWGAVPPLELADFDIVASFHMYHPFTITHYKAEWAGKWEGVPVPTYPLEEKGVVWNRNTIESNYISHWHKLEQKGVPIFVGEFGAYNKTPHDVVIRWMKDCLDIFQKHGWGWALWNFKGPFGPLDSGRVDVVYEKRGEVLIDKEMLRLLTRYLSQ